MIIENLADVRLESMTDSQNRDKLFRLIWIQNISLTINPYFFGLFKHTAPDGKYLLAKIAPESLSIFSPGALFRNGYRTNYHEEEGETLLLKFHSLEKNTFRPISEVITDEFYDLRHHKPSYSKNQWCAVFETDSQIIIFPCFAIGAAYYFLSTSMRIQLLAQNIEGLYFKKSLIFNETTKEASIKLKSNAADDDAMDIVRFETNKNARKHWYAIVNNFRTAEHSNESGISVPFKADFPTAEDLEVTARVKRLKDSSQGKERVLVLEILEENSSFQFDRLTIYRDGKEPRRVDTTRKARRIRTRNIITPRDPTTELTPVVVENDHPIKNPNRENIEVTKEIIPDDDKEEMPVPRVTDGFGSADIGLSEAEHNGDPDVRPGAVERVPPEEGKEVRLKDPFTLTDFQIMVEPLGSENKDVHNLCINGPTMMPRIITGGIRCFYDKKHTKIRRYFYVTFTYRGRNVGLIEIDQGNLPGGCATYVLVSKDKSDFSEDIKEMLGKYASHETIETIKEAFEQREKGKVTFLSKNHPEKKSEEYYEQWRRKLLMRIAMI